MFSLKIDIKKYFQRVRKTPEKKEVTKPSVYDMPNDEFDYGHNVPIHRDTFVEDF